MAPSDTATQGLDTVDAAAIMGAGDAAAAPGGAGAQAAQPDASAQPTQAGQSTQAAQSAKTADMQTGHVVLEDRFEVDPSRHLPELDSPGASAFGCTDRRDSNRELVAFVVDSGSPPRIDTANAIRNADNAGIIKLVSHGPVMWPTVRREVPMFVFEQPQGERLCTDVRTRRDPVSEEILLRVYLPPIIEAMRDLKARRHSHGRINPTNIFLGKANSLVQLGECVTGPAGLGQHLVFEPIERAMADPAGRGQANAEADLYALGVTILYLFNGQLPCAEYSDDVILQLKMERGTYQTLAGERRLPQAVLEALRGLLIDDPSQRWSLDDMELWLSGRRLSPRQNQTPSRAVRPITFLGVDYWNPRPLAMAMAKNPLLGAEIIENGELDNWLRRSVEDEETANRVEEAVLSSRTGRGGSMEGRRLARVTNALDPLGPIRYGTTFVMPDGIGNLMAEFFARSRRVQDLADIILAQLPTYWINVQPVYRPDHLQVAKVYERVRPFLDRQIMGYGIERCLYELNPNMHCLSPIVEPFYVRDLDGLLRALEAVAGREDHPKEPMDRHLAAFIYARNSKINDQTMQALMLPEGSADRAVAIVEMYADIQAMTKSKPLPNLGSWMSIALEPFYERFYSRSLRKKLKQEIRKQAEAGHLRQLMGILKDESIVQRDVQTFQLANRQFYQAEVRVSERERELANRVGLTREIGRQFAAMTSSILAAILMVIIVIATAI